MIHLKALFALCFFTIAQGVAISKEPSLWHFDIDLDLPPKQRWTEVAHVYREYIIGLMQSYGKTAAAAPGFIDEFVANSHLDQFPDQMEELEGIVEEINHPDVNMKNMRMAAVVYELNLYSEAGAVEKLVDKKIKEESTPQACSGVLIAQPNGTVLHGRNLDLGGTYTLGNSNKTFDLNDIAIQVTMHKDNKPLFTFSGFAGAVGVNTGMRFGGWTIEQNTRAIYTGEDSLAAAKQGGLPFPLVNRKLLETVPDFASAKKILSATPFMAPQYIIMAGAGPYEGCVLTIDSLGKQQAGTPDTACLSKEEWHLVQTNEDWNKFQFPAPAPILWDARYAYANVVLWSKGQTKEVGDPGWLMDFMHTQPLYQPFNYPPPRTLFTAVMIPATGYYKTDRNNILTKSWNSWYPPVFFAFFFCYCCFLPTCVVCKLLRVLLQIALRRYRKTQAREALGARLLEDHA